MHIRNHKLIKRLIIKEALNQLHSNVVKSEDANTSSNETNPNTIKSTEQQQSIESNTSDKPKVDNQQAQSQPKDNDDNQGDALKTATQAQQQTLTKKEATTSEVTNRLNTQNSDNNISIDGQTNPTLDSDKSSKQNKDAQSGLNTLKITQSQRQTLNLNHKLQLERKIKPIKLRNKLSIKIKTLLF